MEGWRAPPVRVVVNRRLRTTAGRAGHPTRTVELAGWLMRAPCEAVLDTLRHETAHLLAFDLEPGSRPHGALWRAVVVALGGRPDARYSADLARHWSRVTYYACAEGCRIPRRSPLRPQRLRRLRCATHRLPLAPLADAGPSETWPGETRG